LVVLASVAVSGIARATTDDDEYARATLKGLTRFNLVLSRSRGSEYGDRIDSVGVRTAAELRLRENGIGVATESLPILLVSFYGLPVGEAGCVSIGRVEVLQGVALKRDPTLVTVVPTWSVEQLWGCKCSDTRSYANETARTLLDRFMNAYFAANPRKPGTVQ
jgi:hypothetical protein